MAKASTKAATALEAAAPEVDVFAYLDFRAYLADVYSARKRASRGFSYRAFSRRAGLRSPNFLKLVIDGQRNLSGPTAQRFAKALGLGADETSYWLDLVGFGQAKSIGERTGFYQRLSASKRFLRIHTLDRAAAEYHRRWFMPAIRELAARADFVADPGWIAARLRPQIHPDEVARALEVLLELGLLVREPDGRVHQGDYQMVSTGPHAAGVYVASYQRDDGAGGRRARRAELRRTRHLVVDLVRRADRAGRAQDPAREVPARAARAVDPGGRADPGGAGELPAVPALGGGVTARALIAAAALAVAACGTETGNPVVAELRAHAHSSVPAEFGVGQPAAIARVDRLWLAAARLELLGADCLTIVAEAGPLDGDLAAAVRLTELVFDDAPLCGLRLHLDPALAGGERAGATVDLEATRADGVGVRLRATRTAPIELADVAGAFHVTAATPGLFLGVDVARWLGPLDLADAQPGGDGDVVVDDLADPARAAAFAAALARGLELYRDVDGDGAVGGPDDVLLARGAAGS
ncbi:MAG: TIGR02147 family protein [Kofleriaceae bacterium]